MNQTTRPPRLLRLAKEDNVAVLTSPAVKGTSHYLDGAGIIQLRDDLATGHKVAVCDIAAGEKIFKFGCPIGSATCAIRAGELVHTHNLKSDYLPTFTVDQT